MNEKVQIEDVQGRSDGREIDIDNVGVSGLRYPIVVMDQAHEKQSTVGTLAMSVALPRTQKGTHMSRFVEVLRDHHGEMTMRTLPSLLEDLATRLEASSARLEVKFPYFVTRAAPESGEAALMDYECSFEGIVGPEGPSFTLGVVVPVTSLCPCSKAISDYGAHNQRGYVSIRVRSVDGEDGTPSLIWIEELLEVAERSGSAPVYPLLKRPDERFVTMQAYDNPVFVEDMVRNVAGLLQADARVQWFHVHAENLESIHNHSAFAEIQWERPGTD